MGKKKNSKNKQNKAKNNFVQQSNKVTPPPLSGFSTLNQIAGIKEDKRIFHSSIPIEEPRRIKEPNLDCAICSKKIENIAEALLKTDDNYVHFDCALSSLKETTRLGQNQSISYVGSGNFAVVEKDENGKYKIVTLIPFEKPEQTSKLRMFIQENKI